MNFFGHAYFSPDDAEILAGNVMGDHFKGSIDFMNLPKNLKLGLTLHRNLDSLCDETAGYKEIVSLISPEYGRYRGIIADIFIDHLLSTYWDEISDLPLEKFANSAYSKIEQSRAYFPDSFTGLFQYMSKDNWFLNYRHLENVQRTLKHFETRRGVQMPISESVIDIANNPIEFKLAFFNFIKEMKPSFDKLVLELFSNSNLKV